MNQLFNTLLLGAFVTLSASAQVEDAYSIPAKMYRPNFVILSGCSGGGKSTLLSELASRGYQYVPEPGRQIVKEQEAIGGEALPWKNMPHFLELALSRYMHQFLITPEKEKFVFFDRGIADAIDLSDANNPHFWTAAEKFRYNPTVFLVPPWEAIFKNDPERKHSFADAQKEYVELLAKYQKLNYEVVVIPHGPVQERVDFILTKLAARGQSIGFEDLVAQIEGQLAQKSCVVVGISGFGGAGKSQLAERLRDHFKVKDEQLIRIDQLYGPNPTGPDIFDQSDWPLLTKILDDVRSGRSLNYVGKGSDGAAISCNEELPHVVIVEGVRLLQPRFMPYFDISVWIDCPQDFAKQRAKARDRSQGDDEATVARWDTDWGPKDKTYFEAFQPERFATFLYKDYRSDERQSTDF